MRRALVVAMFLVLVVALRSAWNRRFEACPESPGIGLAEIRAIAPEIPGLQWLGTRDAPVLRMSVQDGGPQVAARLLVPGIEPGRFVHLSFQMASEGLAPGNERWEDGRFMIEWHPPGKPGEVETDAAGSARNDNPWGRETIVLDSKRWPAVPAIRLEHLGKNGSFEVKDLAITPVRERPLWTVGRWILALGWLAWGAVWLTGWPGVSRWRAVCASGVAVVMGSSFVIPGPWHSARPIIGEFELGDSFEQGGGATPVGAKVSSVAGIEAGVIPALGELPTKGSLALRIKMRIAAARPLLHTLLLFGPALVLVWLVGRSAACWVAGLLVAAIESAQFAFGYGFDWTDVADIAFDSAGIAAAVWLYPRLPVWLRRLGADFHHS